jgi:O-antigen/teichoic acid export membrane protein
LKSTFDTYKNLITIFCCLGKTPADQANLSAIQFTLNTKYQIIRDIFGYSASGIISQGLGIVTVFGVASLLGPSDFGVWNAVSLVLVYGAYLELGALSALGRDLPFHHGQRDVEKAATLEGAARRVTIFGALVAALFVIAFSFLPTHSAKMALGLQAMAVVLILQQVYTYHRVVLRSHNCFRELSQQQVLLAAVTLVLAILYAVYFGFEGRLIAAFLAQAVILLYALRRNPWIAVPKFNLSKVWSVIRVGLPILMSGFVLSLLATIDRLMVITFLEEEQLGYFGLAILLTSAVTLIPAMASQVLYPRITHQFGSSGNNVESLRTFVLIPPAILSALLPILIGALYLSLPLVISVLLPAYMPGVAAARIIAVGIFFYGILGLTDYFLVTIGKLKQYALFGCVALFLNIVLDYLFLQLGYGIEGVALGGTLITYFFYSSIVIGYSLSHYTKRFGDWVRYFTRLWLPFVYMIVLLWFVEISVNHMLPSASNTELLFSTIAKVIVYMLFCLPLIYEVFSKLKLDFSKLSLIR